MNVLATWQPLFLRLAMGLSLIFGRAAAQDQLFELIPSDGASLDFFGSDVAVEDDIVVVGAYADDDHGDSSGSVYLFAGNAGQELLKLVPADGAPGDLFGTQVAIGAGRIAVGSPGDDDMGSISGSVYVFDSQTGRELTKLLASDGEGPDQFGSSICLNEQFIVVGATGDRDLGLHSGSAYVFDTLTGQQLFKLHDSDGGAVDYFGISVAISGRRIVVGSLSGNGLVPDSGAVYVFDATTGQQIMKLMASDGAFNAQFGKSVAIEGNRVLVGALHGEANEGSTGSAYVFDVDTGRELYEVTAPDGAQADRFGWSVALSGDRALVGAIEHDQLGLESGAVYVFKLLNGQFLAKLVASDEEAEDQFGYSVDIRGERAVIGSRRGDGAMSNSGSAYLFSIPQTPATTFCAGDGSGTVCPCGNAGGSGEGCANSTGTGALLAAAGTESVNADDLSFSAAQLPPQRPALLYAGTNAIQGGDGIPFGDGLRCAGGDVIRLGVRIADEGGNAIWGPGLGHEGGWVAGDVRLFQTWYRDPPPGSACGAGFNTTNGLEIHFLP